MRTSDSTDHGALRDLLSPQDLADYLDVPVATVYRWNTHGKGPTVVKVGRHVRYRRSDVVDWLESNAGPRTAA